MKQINEDFLDNIGAVELDKSSLYKDEETAHSYPYFATDMSAILDDDDDYDYCIHVMFIPEKKGKLVLPEKQKLYFDCINLGLSRFLDNERNIAKHSVALYSSLREYMHYDRTMVAMNQGYSSVSFWFSLKREYSVLPEDTSTLMKTLRFVTHLYNALPKLDEQTFYLIDVNTDAKASFSMKDDALEDIIKHADYILYDKIVLSSMLRVFCPWVEKDDVFDLSYQFNCKLVAPKQQLTNPEKYIDRYK